VSTEDRRGVTYWLWEQEQSIERRIAELTEDIEDFEAKIVAARTKREDLRMVAVEMRTARSLIETAGLKVERRGTDINVSVERSFAETPAS
jgi:hypothetical protein